jgi:hypothetical protein
VAQRKERLGAHAQALSLDLLEVHLVGAGNFCANKCPALPPRIADPLQPCPLPVKPPCAIPLPHNATTLKTMSTGSGVPGP